MKIQCPNCGGKGNVNDARAPKTGTTVRCPRCSARFQVSAESVLPDPSSGIHPLMDKPSSEPPFPPSPSPFSSMDHDVPNLASLETCSLCRKAISRSHMIHFGDSWVCAQCKPSYLQMLQQGLTRPGDMRFAGFWIRLGAKLVDGVVLWVVSFALGFLASLPFAIADGPATVDPYQGVAGTIAIMLLQISAPVAYTAFFISKYRATPGKMVCGLVITTGDGGHVSAARAVGRHFAEVISGLILLIGYLMIAFDEERRSLHDRICDTRVIHK